MSLSISQLFNERYYLAKYPDVAEAIRSGFVSSAQQHFELYGQREGRSPSILFDNHFYLAKYPDVTQAIQSGFVVSAFDHFVRFGQQEGRTPIPLFDTNFYLTLYGDVRDAIASGFVNSAYEHFVLYGQVEGRSPSGLFDPSFYTTPDVRDAIASGFVRSAFEHYSLYGQFENRSPSALFDPNFYLAQNPDVRDAIASGFVSSAVEHFALYGQFEGRSSSSAFNSSFYLQQYPDVVDAIASGFVVSAFDHYTRYGRLEGRIGVNTSPVASGETLTTAEDIAFTFNLLANDIDPDGHRLFVSGVSNPANGTLINNGDGSFTYAPNSNYNGTDTFTYTVVDSFGGFATASVAINVTAVPDLPVATNDLFTTNEDTTLTFSTNNLLSNDFDPEGDAFFLDGFNQPSNGVLEGLGNGTFVYTPRVNFNGSDSFTYFIVDGVGNRISATANITVQSVNDLPIAGNDVFTADEDTQIIFNRPVLLSNDSDADRDTLFITPNFTPPQNGRLVDLGDRYVYTPNANFFGSDSYTYTVLDGKGGSATASVIFTINAVNDVPVAGNDLISATEDSPRTFSANDLLLNDVDADGGTLLIESFSALSRNSGSLVRNSEGTFTYTPNANFFGSDSFNYVIRDAAGATATATVILNVNSVQDIPVLGNDVFTTNEDNALVISRANLLSNDSDADFDQLLINGFTPATNGTVVDNGNNTFTYTPRPNFFGTDTFSYQVTDQNGNFVSATVTLVVNSVNDAPVANPDVVTLNEDSPVFTIGNVLANDSDADNNAIAITGFTFPNGGSLTTNSNGTFNFTPAPNFNGTTSFTYTINDGSGSANNTATSTVTIIVNPVDDPAVANPDVATATEDTPTTIANVLANDSDVEGDFFSIVGATSTRNGALQNNGDGTFNYAPAPNFNGTDSFNYTIQDRAGNLITSTVTITVNAVNDAPIANPDTVTVNEDTSITIANVLTNDSDIEREALSITAIGTATNGSVVNNNGTLTYTPNNNFFGTDTFIYSVSDASGATATSTVTVTVTPVNDLPIANPDAISTAEDTAINITNVLVNDSDVESSTLIITNVGTATNGSVVNNNGILTYTPRPDFNGTDAFVYTISDGNGGSASSTVTVTVGAVNDAPVANPDAVTTPEDTAITINNILTNDVDAEREVLSITAVGTATNGSVVNNNGTLTYTPNNNFFGSDTFVYTIRDASGATATSTVTVTVTPVNDAPIANPDSVSTSEDTAINITNVLVNDSDVETSNLTITNVGTATNGSVVNNNGIITYTPNSNFFGTDAFVYTISDGNGGSASSTVTVTVGAVNDAPVANPDAVTTPEDTAITINNILTNDVDAEREVLSITAVGTATNGSVVNNNGTLTYTPNNNFFGSDRFTYTISDASGATATSTVTVTVTSVNDAPIANPDSVSTSEDTAINITNVLVNDSDVETSNLTITNVGTATNGSVVNNNGIITYTPNSNFFGTDVFAYTISDGNGGSATSTVTVTVGAVNDAPVANPDAVTTPEDTAITINNILTNDVDAEREVLSITAVGTATNGSVVNNNGTLTYTPNNNFFGSDRFTYTISDASGATATSTVTVTVTSVNDAPVANPDAVAINEDTPNTIINVLANDFDVEGSTLTVIGSTGVSNGVLTQGQNGNFSYTPNLNFSGTDSFNYTITDGSTTTSATVTITVNAVNDPPIARSDLFVVDAVTSTTLTAAETNIIANDVDVDGSITILGSTQPRVGVISQEGSDLIYTPRGNGNDSFTYTIGDGVSSASATVNLIVAQGISSDRFSLASSSSIESSTTIPHATVRSPGGDNNFDYYSFTVNAAGGTSVVGIFDIDFTTNPNTSSSVDTELFLFDGNGTLLASNQDAQPGAEQSGGSTSLNDAFLRYNFTQSGRYVIGVAEAGSAVTIGAGLSGNPLDPDDIYTLHVSIQNPATQNPATSA